MSVSKFLNTFSGGEWTPLLDGRSDLAKYDSSCRVLENMRILPYGGARFRPGTEFIAAAKYANQACRLLPFQYSTATRFVLEADTGYMRFFSNGAQVLSGGNPYEIATAFANAHLFELQFKQINDVVYFTHPSYPPAKLSRIADTNWTLADVAWTWPAMMDENTVLTSTIASSNTAANANTTLTASTLLFSNPGHVGSYWELRHLRESDCITVDLSASSGGPYYSSTLTIEGDWFLTSTERWYGTLELQRSYDAGTTWETIRKFKSKSDFNANASGKQLELVTFRLKYTPVGDPYGAGVWVGVVPTTYVKANAVLTAAESYMAGLVKITSLPNGNTSNTASALIVSGLHSNQATDIWSEGAWSVQRGYPRAVGGFEQRLFLGGTTHQPNSVWGSVTDDFDNFKYGDNDDDAVAYRFATTEQSPVQWLESQVRLQAGTGGSEYAIASGQGDEPLTPTNVSVRPQSAYGSHYLQAQLVNDAIVFLQRQGRKIREMSYDISKDQYVAPDLTLLAEHITRSGVKQIVFARQPDPMLLCVLGNGELGVLTYDREQNVIAWSRWVTRAGDLFESVCAIYGTTEDEIWVAVQRQIGASPARFIERLTLEAEPVDPLVTDDNIKKTGCWLDSAKLYTIGGTTPSAWDGQLTGLSHLIGETVTVVVDGAIFGIKAVSGTGTLDCTTFQDYSAGMLVGYVRVGLPYTGIIQPAKLDIVMANGPSQGKTRRINKVTARFSNTLGASIGETEATLEAIPFRTTFAPTDNSPELFTGDIPVYPATGYNKSGDFVIAQTQPLPLTVLGLAVEFDIFT